MHMYYIFIVYTHGRPQEFFKGVKFSKESNIFVDGAKGVFS